MPVGLKPASEPYPVDGIEFGTARAGLRRGGGDDVLLARCRPGTRYAAMFTRNAFCAAPVTVCRAILAAERPIRGFVVNAGNANAGTGAGGLDDAWRSARHAGEQLGGGLALPFSTGVIGQRLDLSRLLPAIEQAAERLGQASWLDAARAIMTTDTVPKAASRQLRIAGRAVHVSGIAKGAGMICPDLATMLAFVACDAPLPAADLDAMLHAAVDESFNRISVDGDTSTNDAVLLCATGEPGAALTADDKAAVAAATAEVMRELAQAIVRDAEGATKFITIAVDGARDEAEARRVAETIAHSPLVKTAMYASDANWGRILAAVGRSGLEDLDIGRVDLWLDDVRLIRGGEPDPDYVEARGAAVVARPEFRIGVSLGRGAAGTTLWTCDLSHDYVRINAEYRS